MTILGVDGAVPVEDRAAECLTAIARIHEEGIAHLAFLVRSWEAPPLLPLPALPVMVPVVDEDPAELQAEPEHEDAEPAVEPAPVVLLAEEPAMLPLPVVAADAPAETFPDAPTAVELPAVVPAAPVLEESPDIADGTAEDARVLHLAEAATAEIPVQAAA